jgi:multiple sugar transport system substrate-binding protein
MKWKAVLALAVAALVGWAALAQEDTPASRALAGLQALLDAGEIRPGDTFKIMIHSGQRGQLAPAVQQLSQLTGLNVELVVIGYEADIYTKAMNEAVVRTGEYDLFLTFCNWIGDMAEAGLIVPLDAWIAKYDPELSEGPNAYVKPLDLFTTRYGGHYYALGMDNDALVLFYRKDLLEDPDEQAAFQAQYGRPLRLPETWEEFDQISAFFDRPEEGFRGVHLYATRQFAYTSWAPRFIAKGGIYFDPYTMDPMINTPEGLEALREIVALVQNHMFPEAYTGDWSAAYTFFPEGKVFWTIAWPSLGHWASDPEISRIAGNVGFAQLPGEYHDGVLYRATPHVVGWSLSVSRYGNHPEAAYLIAQWLNSPSVSTECITRTGTLDPFRLNHFQDEELMAAYGPELGPVLMLNTSQSFPDISLRGANEYIDVLNLNLQAAAAGQITPEEALARVEQEWQAITDRLGRGRQIESWLQEIKNYPEHIRRLWVLLGKATPDQVGLEG